MRLFLVAATLGFVACPSPAVHAAEPALAAKETTLFELPAQTRLEDSWISLDGKHTCLRVGQKYGTGQLQVDGKPSREFADGLTFSRAAEDGWCAYLGYAKEGHFVMLSGRETLGPLAGIVGFTVSPDGKRWAYAQKQADGEHLFVDGKEIGVFPVAKRFHFSADSKRAVASVKRDGSTWTLVGDLPPALAPEKLVSSKPIEQVCLSSDGTRLACVLAREQGWVLVHDGEVVLEAEAFGQVVMTADGQQVAAVVDQGEVGAAVLHQGKVGPSRDMIVGLVLSPDGAHYAHWAPGTKTKAAMVLDGVEIGGHDGAAGTHPFTGHVFSPDGKRFAYFGVSARPEGLEAQLIVDRRPMGSAFATTGPGEIGQIVFGPDGAHVAATEHRGERWVLTIDGQEVRPAGVDSGYDGILRGPIFDGPTACHLFAARKGKLVRVDVAL